MDSNVKSLFTCFVTNSAISKPCACSMTITSQLLDLHCCHSGAVTVVIYFYALPLLSDDALLDV